MAPDDPLLRGTTAPLAIAHRGASARAPENTMAAFRAGWADGATWTETDVQPTSDGARVLIHDEAVDRTTDGTGPVRSHTAAQLARLDAGAWFGPQFTGARIPALAELLGEMTGARRLLLEIKGEHDEDQVRAILADIEAAGAQRRVVLQSFEVPALEHIRALRPTEPVGLLVEAIGPDPVGDCRRLGAITYNPSVADVLADPGIVTRLHAADIAVIPWTADDPDEWRRLTEAGVDGIFTNRPGELLTWQAASAESAR